LHASCSLQPPLEHLIQIESTHRTIARLRDRTIGGHNYSAA
jgi:hypothetical protein